MVLVIEEHSLLEKFQLGLILSFLCVVRFKTDTLALQILLEGKLEEKQTNSDYRIKCYNKKNISIKTKSEAAYGRGFLSKVIM